MIVDYCNYAFQSNFNLMNAVKIIKKELKMSANSNSIISKIGDQILFFLYNILTDSLALNALNTNSDKSYSVDTFILSFKNLQNFYQTNWERFSSFTCFNLDTNALHFCSNFLLWIDISRRYFFSLELHF
jgi:hypothetical protein